MLLGAHLHGPHGIADEQGRRDATTSVNVRPVAPVGFVAQIAGRLFGASPALTGTLERRQARLLAGFNFVAGLVTLACVAKLDLLSVAASRADTPVFLGMVTATAAGGYALSRTRHVRLAAAVSIAAHWLLPISLLALDARYAGPADRRLFLACSWFTVSILLAGLLVRPWIALLLGSATCLVPAAAAALGFATSREEAAQALALVASVTAMTYLFRRHRDQIEAEHRAELLRHQARVSAHASTLAALERSLEHRVESRTAAMRRSLDELHRTHQELRKSQSALVAQERLASLGRSTAAVAREMSAPLTAIRVGLSEARGLVDDYTRSIEDPDTTDNDHRTLAAHMTAAIDLASQAAERATALARSVDLRDLQGAPDRRSWAGRDVRREAPITTEG